MPGTGTANPFGLVLPRERKSDPSVPDHTSSRLPTTVRLVDHAVLQISRINRPVHADTDMDMVATPKATTGSQSRRSRTQTAALLECNNQEIAVLKANRIRSLAALPRLAPVKTVHATLSAQSPAL
ncbi:hypothetical protein Asppvi_007909 [Aspergillus pseudoviridinutans]|uniref:Uncharacterized protein n=1 Tax=Aspergillus pseudoviridinutans TaxID=1517512 RepID=A0A9P3BCV6_9EURO|nr:uncharacterized protein Asppvi_007909 [Aspergillus pseudoviridinutans]GIJ88981.1 hypothetical protein Asppvi_007909 [Aspergillus pseudoviridinutans]